jgi:glycosyltransferase involved in cell wall biosynthesis
MPAVMQTLDMLVLPSLETKYWTEQFGRVLIEAMACGVPVIASRSGGIPDVVGEAGILFTTDDAGELAAHVRLLLENPSLCRRYAERGRARARAEFDVPVLAQRLGTAIQEAVKLRRRVR